MNRSQSKLDLGTLLLVFYECLTDSDQLETLMDVLTSWLDDEEARVVSPTLDHHADKAWRLLGEISEQDYRSTVDLDPLQTSRFEDAAAVEAALGDQIRPEDLGRLQEWLASSDDALLLRIFDGQSTELVILAQESASGGYTSKRTGAEFQTLISKFVADSFELSHAEFLLLKELLLGGTLREIADRLGKSWETTRSQVKTLTNKLGVSSQGDILRMANQAASLMPAKAPRSTSATAATEGQIERPDGRTIAFEVDGPPSNKVLVFLHGMTQGRHWPAQARALARNRGWQVVRISRAGRGASSLNLKEGEALLQDNVADVMAVLDHVGVPQFSIFGAADGFAVGYQLALRYPERVQKIVGLEVVPPILTRKTLDGFSGKMKTFGLANLYAPKTVKYMLGLAMHRLESMEDRHAGVHPLMGVELRKHEDADGLRADDLNFRDLAVHRAEGMWRDASFCGLDWAYAPANSNIRPAAALILCDNSMIKSPGQIDTFAQRIGAPIHRIESYFPYMTSSLPLVLDLLEAV